MKQIITVANQKGGIGKSTTAQAIGVGYSILKGDRVLLVDLDAQANLTIATGVNRENIKSSFDLLSKDSKASVGEVIQPVKERVDIIPADNRLSEIAEHLPKIGRYDILKKALAPIMDRYDLIVIDTPPALSDLTLNALMIATRVAVPAQADLFSLEAIKELSGTITAIKEYNKELTVAGILLTRYQPRAILTQELTDLIEETAKSLNTKLFNTKIREAIAIKEAQTMHTDIFSYAPNSKVAKDYEELLAELEE